jgi:hypothetical protein
MMCSKYCRPLFCIYCILSCYDFQIFPRIFCYTSGGSNRYWCNLTFQVLRLFYIYSKILVFFFPLPFARNFCLRILLSLSICIFYVFNYYIWPIFCNLSVCLSVSQYVCLSVYLSVCLSVRPSVCLSVCLSVRLSVYLSVCLSVCPSVSLSVCMSVCTASFQHTVTSFCSHTGFCVCVFVSTICLSFHCLELCILSKANVYKHYHVSLSTHSSTKWSILMLGGQYFHNIVYISGIYQQFVPSEFYS